MQHSYFMGMKADERKPQTDGWVDRRTDNTRISAFMPAPGVSYSGSVHTIHTQYGN